MNIISRAWLFNQSPVQTVFRQCLFHTGQCPIRSRYTQPHAGQCKLISSAFTRLFNLSKVQSLQTAAKVTSKPIWQDQQRGVAADTKTTAVTIWEDLKQIRFSPVPALVLGFSGLIPFIAPPAYMIFSQAFYSQMVFAQTAYGACILSFLGGVRWGFVIPEESECQADWFNLGYSVVPSLVAWTALLLPQPISILVVMGGVAGAAYFDTALKGYPAWFKGLRFTLSLVAVLSLWTVFLCQFMLSAPSEKQIPKADENT